MLKRKHLHLDPIHCRHSPGDPWKLDEPSAASRTVHGTAHDRASLRWHAPIWRGRQLRQCLFYLCVAATAFDATEVAGRGASILETTSGILRNRSAIG